MRKISLLVVFITTLTAFSGYANNMSEALVSCSKVEQDSARLACFDKLSADIDKIAKIDKSSEQQIVKQVLKPKKISEEERIANFGALHIKSKNDVNEEKIVLTISKLNKNRHGKLRFIFKNGQRWKQTDTNRLLVKEGDSVALTKGALGAIYLKLNKPDTKRKIRVKRTK